MHAYRLSTCVQNRLAAALVEDISKPRLALYYAHTSSEGIGGCIQVEMSVVILRTISYRPCNERWAMASGDWRGVQSDGARRRSRWTIAAFHFERMCFPVARQILRVASC